MDKIHRPEIRIVSIHTLSRPFLDQLFLRFQQSNIELFYNLFSNVRLYIKNIFKRSIITISPKMKLSDVKAVSQFIQGVEIRGTEVDAYLNTRSLLIAAATTAEEAGKKDEDVIACEMRLDQAQNLFTLMQRGTLKGVEAEKWKEIVEALREAVKTAQEAAK